MQIYVMLLLLYYNKCCQTINTFSIDIFSVHTFVKKLLKLIIKLNI